MKRKEAIIKTLLLFLGILAESFSFTFLLFTEYKVLSATFLVISILFTSGIYFWITKNNKNNIRVKGKKVNKKRVQFFSNDSLDMNTSNIQEIIPFYLLNKLQKGECFKCYAYFLEDEKCIVLEIKYPNLEDDHFYFYDYNLFFELFEVVEE